MRLPFFIARRYLFARKSHNVINIISAISAAGLAIGTAALTVILSVYNGFDDIAKSMLDETDPDIRIVSIEGKTFRAEDKAFEWLYSNNDVENMCTVLQDQVFVTYENRQTTAIVKGVDEIFEEETPLRDKVTDGQWRLTYGDNSYAAVGQALARSLQLSCHFLSPLYLYFPKENATFSGINPLGSLNRVKVIPSCEFSAGAETDSRTIIVPMKVMSELIGKEDEVSCVEVRLRKGLSPKKSLEIKESLSGILPEGLKALDRTEQNPELYKMLKYEKGGVYLIMLFIVIVLGFSIFGSMRMLIIDKSTDIATLKAIGMDNSTIRRIFTLEGWMITLFGMVAGLVIGIAFCLIQKEYGIVEMPGNYIISAYPVILKTADVLASAAGITVAGYLISLIASRKI